MKGLVLGLRSENEEYVIEYDWNSMKNSPIVTYQEKTTILNTGDEKIDALFFQDFGLIWKFVKNSKLRILEIQLAKDITPRYAFPQNTCEFYDGFEELLDSQNINFQAEIFVFQGHSQAQLLQILPHFDSGYLKTLGLILEFPRDWNKLADVDTVKIDEIVELEQWKNAEHLKITGLITPSEIEDFFHFSNVEITIQTVMERELRELKEAFLQDHNLLHFKIQYINMDILTLLRVFGLPSDHPEDPEDSESWYFEIPEFKKYLKVIHYQLENANHAQMNPVYSSIHFWRLSAEI